MAIFAATVPFVRSPFATGGNIATKNRAPLPTARTETSHDHSTGLLSPPYLSPREMDRVSRVLFLHNVHFFLRELVSSTAPCPSDCWLLIRRF